MGEVKLVELAPPLGVISQIKMIPRGMGHSGVPWTIATNPEEVRYGRIRSTSTISWNTNPSMFRRTGIVNRIYPISMCGLALVGPKLMMG